MEHACRFPFGSEIFGEKIGVRMSFADAFVMIEAGSITDLARLDCFNEGGETRPDNNPTN